ncbi:MAG: M48 family peptidase, partial [Pseudomonadota bacterium]|nr:M48 family peptidase [Pseudomonadota bacterium]
MNEFSWIFLAAVLLMTAVEIWLSFRQGRYVAAHRDEVPTAFKEQISLNAHQKAADYTVAKGKFKRTETFYSMVILLLWTLGGGLAVLYGAWSQLEMGPMLGGVIFFLSFLLIGSLLELPFSYYKTFVLEDKFGFNRQTPGL